ncbi:MAG: DUF2851 family protein [Verrucomicrobia bacterium]|nr:DUF2851 family protein [Verrucomicrobiota bacterium]
MQLSNNPFPRAARYRLHTTDNQLREPAAVFPYSERHLQCAWFDPRYRPANLTTLDGEPLAILSPGRWNLGAGPDFLDAQLIVGKQRRRLQGDVEIHVAPSDWHHHGHHTDPAYRRVVAHVTYAAQRLPEEALPPGAVQVSLKSFLAADPDFFFESIDVSAYPYAAAPQHQSVAQGLLTAHPPERIRALLDAAGEERLRVKSNRMRAAIALTDAAQALYESLLTALGYAHNRAACRLLARQLPIAELTNLANGNAHHAFALLAGMAGLLPATPKAAWSAECQTFLRSTWDIWWKHRDAFEPRLLSTRAWRLSGLRPLNHPLRRLAAAAVLFSRYPNLDRALLGGATTDTPTVLKSLLRFLDCTGGLPFWDHHRSLGSRAADKPIALIGAQRQSAMLTNCLVPFLAAHDRPITGYLDHLPNPGRNELTRHTAHLLFGPDHNPSLYDSGLRQQGLLQIFHDYVLTNQLPQLGERLADGFD